MSKGTRNLLGDIGWEDTTDATDRLYEMALRKKKELEEREKKWAEEAEQAAKNEEEEMKKLNMYEGKKTTVKDFVTYYNEKLIDKDGAKITTYGERLRAYNKRWE